MIFFSGEAICLRVEYSVVDLPLPVGPVTSTIPWEALARTQTTLVVLMGVANLAAICAALTGAGLDPATPAAVVEDGCGPRSRVVRGTVSDIATLAADADVQPPAITVIGAVAGLDLTPEGTAC